MTAGCEHCEGSDLGPGYLPSDWPCGCNPDYRPPYVDVIEREELEMPERLRRLEEAGRLRRS